MIAHHSAKFNCISRMKRVVLATDNDRNELAHSQRDREKATKKLKRLRSNAVANQKYRDSQKEKMKAIQEKYPIENLIKQGPGKLPIEHTQQDLLKTILEIVQLNSSADDRRRSSTQSIMLNSILPKTKFKVLPFDYYCPSIRDTIKKKICSKCNIYFSTGKALKSHRRYGCFGSRDELDDDSSDSDSHGESSGEDTEIEENSTDDVPIMSIRNFLTPLYKESSE